MLHTHYLNTATHLDFLKQERVDPITGEKIEEGHTIVICAACKSAFFIESWEYLGNTHCNQEETLSQIPINKSLQLVAKPLEYLPFLFRKGSYFVWKEDRQFLQKSLLLILGAIFFVLSVGFFAILIGSLTTPLVGLGFVILCLFVLGGVVSSYVSIDIEKKINPKKVNYLALDLKNKSINCKKGNKETKIVFDEIIELRYSLNYNSNREYVLSLEIVTKKEKKIKYYTLMNRDEIPHWSKFLEELPYNLTVLNQK
jgi:hypothetical protein